jgi:hypothetical protein
MSNFYRGETLRADELNSEFSLRVFRGGDTMTGPFILSRNPQQIMEAATKQYVDAAISGYGGVYLPLSGGTLSGPLTLSGPPTQPLQAVTKQYVDTSVKLVTIADNAPTGASAGTLWWDSTGGQMYVRYTDPNSTQWVLANNFTGEGNFLPLAGGTMTGPLNVTATGSTTSRSVQDRFAEVTNVRDFGAKGDGATDDSAAVQAAFNKAANGGDIWFPVGTYLLNSAIAQTIVAGGITVRGAGPEVTILRCNASGISLTLPANSWATVEDLSIINNAGTTQGTGIAITAPNQSTYVALRNLELCGNVTASTGWQTAVSLINIGNPMLHAIRILAPNGTASAGATGIYYSGTATGSLYATGFKITSSLIQGGQYGLSIGPCVQGVYVIGTDIIGNDYGVYWPASSGAQEWLVVGVGSHTNCTTRGILATNVGWVAVTDTLHIRFGSAAANWAAIDCEGCNNIAIQANNIYGNGGSNTENAIILADCTGQPATVTGNVIGAIGSVRPAIAVSGNTGNLSCVGNSGNGILGGFISDTTGLTTNQYLGNLSNGISDASYTGGVFKVSGGLSASAGIVGTTTNNNANAGSVGELVTSVVSAGFAITTATSTNITTISLTAGDWDVSGNAMWLLSATATNAQVWVSTVSATQPAGTSSGYAALVATVGNGNIMPTGTLRVSIVATTTVYLTVLGFFTGTCSIVGTIRARRVR